MTPFVEPLRGRRAILEYWIEVARTERDIHFESDILAVSKEVGVAHWRASFTIVPPVLKTTLGGIFVITLNAAGLCPTLREWWHKQQ